MSTLVAMTVVLPSRYEDLAPEFRGRLRPVEPLINLVKQAEGSMAVSGGIRFLPIYGQSGSGKTSAVQELATHLPECDVFALPRETIGNQFALDKAIHDRWKTRKQPKLLVAVVDQYEEAVARRAEIPTQFVESLSLLDRSEIRHFPTLFVWLTTSRDFQAELAGATTRNERILVTRSFEVSGPEKEDWPDIIEETFEFHNHDTALAEYDVLRDDLEEIAYASGTIGQAILEVGRRLALKRDQLRDISEYQVVMVWPVDGSRIDRVTAFTNQAQGYKLDWNAFYQSFDESSRHSLPFHAYNRTRLYFDVRLVPVAIADLHRLALRLDSPDEDVPLATSYVNRLGESHFATVVSGAWGSQPWSRMRARDSKRAAEAATWYEGVTGQSVALGRRIARSFREMGYTSRHEETINAGNTSVRTDVYVERPAGVLPPKVLLELKVFSTQNTMPATIRDQIRGTLRKYANFAGFLDPQ
jgi:hypothetical protein